MTDPMQSARPLDQKPVFTKDDFLTNNHDYPDWKPFDEGVLHTADGHGVFYQVAGNPNGIPVVTLHGGPGEGAKPAYGEHFDPNIHKIVIFDQRGAGNSTPYAETDNNNITNLVDDIRALKKHLDVQEPWNVYGISWGTTLAMHYATTHPDDVETLILDASCFGDQPSAEWLVDPSPEWLAQGTEEQQAMKAGAYDEYVGFIRNATFLDQDQEAKDALNALPLYQAYYQCLRGDYGEDVAIDAATQFMIFDTKLLAPELTNNSPEIKGARHAAEDNLALSKLFYHFYINEYNALGPEPLIDEMVEHWKGKTVMIHGTEDIVTPLSIAERLEDRLTNAGRPPILYTYEGYGHFKMDDPARIATRQVVEREMRDVFDDTGIRYEDMVLDRIEALENLGLELELAIDDLVAIKAHAQMHKFATGQESELTVEFIDCSTCIARIDVAEVHVDIKMETNPDDQPNPVE